MNDYHGKISSKGKKILTDSVFNSLEGMANKKRHKELLITTQNTDNHLI